MIEEGQSPDQPTLDLELRNEKQERLEAEKVATVRAVASAKFDTIRESGMGPKPLPRHT